MRNRTEQATHIRRVTMQVYIGHISKAQLRQIAEYKLPDLNCNDVEAAMKVVEGSARNMGITIDD